MAESGTRTTGPVNQRLLDISANDTNSDASIILRSREKNTSNVKKSTRGLISFSPHSNTIVNQKLIFPQASGTVGQVLKIDSVSNTNNLTLNWGEGGGGSSALTYTNSALQSDNNSLLRLTSSTGTESDIMFIAGNNITLGTSISSQYQLGNDITPPTTDLHFGSKVKMNSTGDRVLISTGAKSLHMYKLTNNTWSQLGNVIESGGNTVWTIDMDNSGDVVAFGNYIRSHGGLTMCGSTKVLKYTTSTNWQIVNTEIFGQHTQDREGQVISLSGNGNVIATASIENDETGTNNGQVRIFEDTSSGWNQRGSDLHLSGYSGDTTEFGRLIQLNENGNILAVFSDIDNIDAKGNVRFFQYANNTWTQYSIIRRISTDYRLHHYPLMELNNDGDIIALQTQNTSTGDFNLVVYSYSGSSWNQRGNLLNFGDRMTDLAIDNDITTIAVGTDQYSTGGLYRGLAKFYKYNNNTWSQIGTTLIGEASQHYMGGALSINSTGTRAIVGISGYGRPTTSPFGKVEIYNLPGTVNNAITINSTGSGIVNNRIDGDLTIGEDDSEILTIASKLNIPGGETGNVLIKDTDGLMKLSGSVTTSTIGTKIDGVPVSDFGTDGKWQIADNATANTTIHKIATITLPRAGKYLVYSSGINFMSNGTLRHSAMIRHGQSFGGLADNTNNSATDNSQLRVLVENYYLKEPGTDKHYNICLTCYYEWDGVTTDGEQLHLELDTSSYSDNNHTIIFWGLHPDTINQVEHPAAGTYTGLREVTSVFQAIQIGPSSNQIPLHPSLPEINTSEAGKALTVNSAGTALEYGDLETVVGFFVQPTATVTGTYGTDGAGADYSLSAVNKTYPLQQWTIKGYGGYYMNNSNPRFGFNSGHFDCTSNSGGKFTAPSNGNYYISYNIYTVTITGWYHTIGIYINGNPANGGTVLPNNGSGAGDYGFSYSKHHIGGVNSDPDTFNTNFHKPHNYTESFIINLQQNDYVQLVVYSRNDGHYIIGKSSYFCIYKM